jgi:four helix bundle protein
MLELARVVGQASIRSPLRQQLTDADGENSETGTWLDFAHDCGYLSKHDHEVFSEKCREVGAMLGSMINDPSSFILQRDL